MTDAVSLVGDEPVGWLDRTIGEVADAYPETMAVSASLGIDLCGGGRRPGEALDDDRRPAGADGRLDPPRRRRAMGRTTAIGERILVPLDGSDRAERALPYARALATPNAEVLLVRVAPDPRFGVGSASSALDRGAGAIDDRLEAAASRLRAGPGMRVETRLDHGDPAAAILRVAQERGADLIVVAGQGWREPARRYRGSVADRVAREAAASVLFVHAGDGAAEDAQPRVRRVVVPLDGSTRAEGALATAAAVAGRCAASIRLLTAVDPAYGVPPASVPDAVRASRDALAEGRQDALRMLEAVGAGIIRGGGSATWQVLDGPPAEAILGAVGEGDLIVLAGRGRSTASGWPIGSVTAKVVRFAPVPVLVHHAPS